MAEMSFGARRHTAIRKAEENNAPIFNLQALLQGCSAVRPDDAGDQTPLIVDFPDRPAKMLAAVLPDYGMASRLKVQLCDLPRLPLGKLKSTEVVVEVHAASVNPTDCKQRKGLLSQIWPLSLPCILGIDLAGRVVRAGEDAPFSEGDEVFGRQQLGRMVDLNGSYAEYCIVEAADLYRKPTSLSMEDAASVPYACLAAYAALAHVGRLADKRKQADKSVLVLGGSGGVGTFAVQLAKQHFGCFVIASSSSKNQQLIKDLGADEAVDYDDPSFLKSMGYTKFDVIVDTVGGDDYWAAFKDSLKGDGVYVTTVGKERRSKHTDALDSMSALQYRADYFLRQAFNTIGAAKNYHILTGSQILSSDLRIVASLLEKGTIRPIVDSVYSLYDIAKAHEKSETQHAVGKMVIQVRKRGQSHSESCSEHQMDKTGALGARMHGVLASGLGAPTRKDNTASASALPNSNSRGKVHFNGMKKLEEEEEEVDEGEGSDAYAAYINKINNHSHTSHPAPSSQVKSSTRDMLGSMTYASKEMTYGAPGVTTTASSRANPLSQMPPLSGRASAPGTGGSALETRLEQLQREVAESTARVQALKNRNTTIASNSTGRAAPPAAAAAQARSQVGAKDTQGGTANALASKVAPPTPKPKASIQVLTLKVAAATPKPTHAHRHDSPPEEVEQGFDSHSSPLHPAALQVGLQALQASRERQAREHGSGRHHAHAHASSPSSATHETDEDQVLGLDNPFRPPASKGPSSKGSLALAPPSSEPADAEAAAKRAAALVKLREMTMGLGLDDPRLGNKENVRDGVRGEEGGEGGRMGMLGGGASTASASTALREARLKAEMLKAKEAETRMAKQAEAEGRLAKAPTQATVPRESSVLRPHHGHPADSEEDSEEEEGASDVDGRGGRGGRGGSGTGGTATAPHYRHHLNGKGLDDDDEVEEEEEMGFGGGKVDAREAARMGLGVGVAAAAAPAAAPAPAPGRGGGNADDETASMFKQFKLGGGRGSGGGGGGGGGAKPYPLQKVDPPKMPADEEMVEDDEEERGKGASIATPAQRPAGAKPRVRINDTPEERQIPSKPLNGGESGGAGGGSVASVTEAEILYEGLLRRKKEDHGRFEDPYKMVCVCRLQGSVLRVRLTHNGEVVGLEEQFDVGAEWRLMPRSDKPDRFSLHRIRPSPDGLNQISFKAETKDDGNGWVDAVMRAQSGAVGGGGGGGLQAGGTTGAKAKQAAIAARIEEEEKAGKPAGPQAGVGMILKEVKMPGGEALLAVKSLAPGAPAISCGMIAPGDYLISVDNKKVTTSAEATKAILGELGSSITMQLERDGERFVVALRRGKAASLNK